MNAMCDLESRFDRSVNFILGELTSGEAASIEFSGERSQFMRFNGGKIRQIGEVDSSFVSFRLFKEGQNIEIGFSVSDDSEENATRAGKALSRAREEVVLLPEDPFRMPPLSMAASSEIFEGEILPPSEIPEAILAPAAGLDFTGLYTQGPVARGAANSAGSRHWFATETFIADWSLWLPNGKAVKYCYSGREWRSQEHLRQISAARSRLAALQKPEKNLLPGEYRAYICPDAFAKIIPFFSWHGLSEREMREGESAFLPLKEGRRSLSPAFSLNQDFNLGVEPRFNSSGEVAPIYLPLIEKGKLAATLVSEKSSHQYGIASNASTDDEKLRSPSIAPGELTEDNILATLGTGVFVSNLHYLNWSDVETARITGMTRFACLWVENGKAVAPISDMRFDESVYDLLGAKLEALTKERSFQTETSSYRQRELGGRLIPGLLLSSLQFTI